MTLTQSQRAAVDVATRVLGRIARNVGSPDVTDAEIDDHADDFWIVSRILERMGPHEWAARCAAAGLR